MTFRGRKTHLKITALTLLKSAMLSATLAVALSPLHAISATASVAGGNLNAASRPELADRDANSRRRSDANVLDGTPRRREPGRDRMAKHLAALSAIA